MNFNDDQKLKKLLINFRNSLKDMDEKLFRTTCEDLGPVLVCWCPNITNDIFYDIISPIKSLNEININLEPFFILLQLNYETFDEFQKSQLFDISKTLYPKLPNAENCFYCLIFMVDYFVDKNLLEVFIGFSKLKKNYLREKVSYGLFYLIEEIEDSDQKKFAEDSILNMCNDLDDNVRKEAQINFHHLIKVKN